MEKNKKVINGKRCIINMNKSCTKKGTYTYKTNDQTRMQRTARSDQSDKVNLLFNERVTDPIFQHARILS